MSSLPGHTLEDFVAWQLDLRVVGYENANVSAAMAEAMGHQTRRRDVTPIQFRALVNLFEAFESEGDTGRDIIERRLNWFDEETQSWRDYASYSFDEFDDIGDIGWKMATTFASPDYVGPKWNDVPLNDPYDDEGSPHGKWAAWMAELMAYCTKQEKPWQCVLAQGHSGDCDVNYDATIDPPPLWQPANLIDVALPDTAPGVIVGPEAISGPNAIYVANAVRILALRSKGRKDEEELMAETLDHVEKVYDATAITEETEILSFLSVALDYREEIERRWAKDNATSTRLRLYGYEVHPIPCPIYSEMNYIPGDACQCGSRHVGGRA